MIRAFVSSTYQDLKAHRAYVIDRLERAGIFVDPMEKWTAASDEPKQLSQDRVKDCDVCILLVGFRLGHVAEGEGLSITQMEYAEALRQELDVLIFLADDKADWSAEALDELSRDARIKKWRDELKEHHVTGFFGPQPESTDVGSALLRLYEKWASEGKQARPGGTHEEKHPINIRAYSSSGAALIIWRTESLIPGCLGFAIHRRTLGAAGTTELVLNNRIGLHGTPKSSARWPIQRFRWVDRLADDQEARYKVVPVMGTPDAPRETADPAEGSAWTQWISRKTAHTPGIRVFFNDVGNTRTAHSGANRTRTADAPLNETFLGGELRRTLLASLAGAKQLNQRVFVTTSGLNDADVVRSLKNLGRNLYLVLGNLSRSTEKKVIPAQRVMCRQLRKAGVHLYLRLVPRPHVSASSFMVLCDELGSPRQVWAGSGPWTERAFCVQENSGILVDSVAMARSFLDRWECLRDAGNGFPSELRQAGSRPTQVQLGSASATLWYAPSRGEPELRDAARLVRGAREGVLFLIRAMPSHTGLLNEILQLSREDLFIEGISASGSGSDVTLHVPNGKRLKYPRFHNAHQQSVIGSTVILIDPFGPHSVVITGSHDLSYRSSRQTDSNLLIFENAPGMAAEYAVHIIRLYEYYLFRAILLTRPRTRWTGLLSDESWQRGYFSQSKRTEFNFLFGTLSPGP
jgi:hypothetical protein